MKRPKPVTSCTNCRASGHNIDVVNEQCMRTVLHGQRCQGTNQSALGAADWTECPSCAAFGSDRIAHCFMCRGSGWLFLRPR